MEKVIYRAFEAAICKTIDGKPVQEQVYRGVRFTPTNRKIISGTSGKTKLIYRSIITN